MLASSSASETATVSNLDIDPFDEGFLSDPYAYHEALREADPLAWLPKINAFAMARYHEVAAALKNHDAFCSGRGVGVADFARESPYRPPSLLIEADPPIHDRTRGLMNRIVSLKALKELRPRWRDQADKLADELVARRRFDAVRDLGEVYPMMVFPDTIGVPEIGEGHKAGRDIGYCHLEKLHNLEALPPFGFTVSCFPHKIKGASAGWTRAVAIIEDNV